MKTRVNMKSYKKSFNFLISGIIAFMLILSQSSFVQARFDRYVDVVHDELRSITIEGWDKDYSGGGWGWRLSTNRDPKEKGLTKAPYKPFDETLLAEREVKLIPGTPIEIRENIGYNDNYILGIRYSFTFPGDNLVYIYPPDVDQYTVERVRFHLSESVATGKAQVSSKGCYKNPAFSKVRAGNRTQVVECVNGINLPGLVHKISVWVLGRGNKYDLEAILEDWRGSSHRIKMGTVNHIGWKPFSADVPKDIPQVSKTFPQTKTLVFRKLVLRPTEIRGRSSNANEEAVYYFFDELRILASNFQQQFDGAQIDFDQIDCERKNQLYKSLRENSRAPEQWPRIADCTKAPGPAKPLPNTVQQQQR